MTPHERNHQFSLADRMFVRYSGTQRSHYRMYQMGGQELRRGPERADQFLGRVGYRRHEFTFLFATVV